MNKVSLKWRFTIITVLILSVICIIMLLVSTAIVQNQFVYDFIDIEIVNGEGILLQELISPAETFISH